jgi:uncharacterized protein (TIGR02246 family)
MNPKNIAETVVEQLEAAWNAADGAAFAAPFEPDAEFVNVRGDPHTGRQAIAAGHDGIFSTIYAGSTVRYSVLQARELGDGVILAHISGKLDVPAGPMAGETNALASIVLIRDGDEHRVAAFHNTVVASG